MKILFMLLAGIIPVFSYADQSTLNNAINACNAALQNPSCSSPDPANHPNLKDCTVSANGRVFQARSEEKNALFMEIKNQCYAFARQVYGN